jgi:thiol-disulfide isomerase/thioredoxin
VTVATSPTHGRRSEATSQVRARRHWLLVGVPVLAAAVLVAVLLVGAGSAPVLRLRPFSLPRVVDGHADGADPVAYPLPTGARGRPVVLVFFASWCVDCHVDLPVAARVARAEARSGNAAVFLGIDGNDSPAAGWAFAQRSGVTFPIADDQQELVANQLGLTGLPSTVVVAPGGRVVRRFTGAISASTLEQAVADVAPAHAVRPG